MTVEVNGVGLKEMEPMHRDCGGGDVGDCQNCYIQIIRSQVNRRDILILKTLDIKELYTRSFIKHTY